jgi:hypothetical protein
MFELPSTIDKSGGEEAWSLSVAGSVVVYNKGNTSSFVERAKRQGGGRYQQLVPVWEKTIETHT